MPSTAFSEVESGEPPADRRPRGRIAKKARTREDLIRAATDLFLTKGFRGTTIDDITEAAGVSRRTFFRYFTSKETVPLRYEEMVGVLRAIRQQPPDTNDVIAVRDAYLSLLPYQPDEVASVLKDTKAFLKDAALERQRLARQRYFREEVADALSARRGLSAPDTASYIAAAIAGAVIEMAYEQWAQSDGGDDIQNLLVEHFSVLDDVMRQHQPADRGQHASTRRR